MVPRFCMCIHLSFISVTSPHTNPLRVESFSINYKKCETFCIFASSKYMKKQKDSYMVKSKNGGG